MNSFLSIPIVIEDYAIQYKSIYPCQYIACSNYNLKPPQEVTFLLRLRRVQVGLVTSQPASYAHIPITTL